MLGTIETILRLWTAAARRSSWLILALFAAATIAGGYYAARTLSVNTDTSAMLDPELAFQKRAAALKEAFPQLKTDIIVVVRATTLDEADTFAAALTSRLQNQTETVSAVFSPAADPFFRENGLLYLTEGELEARLAQMTKAAGLIETLVSSPKIDTFFKTLAENDELAERSELGQETLSDIYAELGVVVEAALAGERRPFAWMGALDTTSKDAAAHTRLVYATPVLDFTRLQPAKTAIEALRDEIALLSADYAGRVDAYITGDPALRAEELESVTQGIGLSFLLSFVLVTTLLLFAFRSLFMAALTMITLIITLVLTSAFAAFAVGELNLVSVAFTVLLVGLGLDFAIHLLLHVQERKIAGQTTAAALNGAVHEVGPAMAIAAPTTALAFLSFVPTQFNGIAQLGVIAGAGVIIAFLVSITFLPACLSAFPRPAARASGGLIRKGFRALERISIPVTIVTVLTGLAALLIIPDAKFDADPMALRNPDSPSVYGFNLLFEDESTVPYRLTRLVDSEADAMETSRAAKALDVVRSARSLPDFVPEDQDAKLELIDIAASTLVFALDQDGQASEENEAGASGKNDDGVTILRDRLTTAYEDGSAKRLADLLTAVNESSDPAVRTRLQENIFAFWPALIERLRAQFNADYVELETLPASLADRYKSADGLWRVDILPSEDVRDEDKLEDFVDRVSALFPDIGGGAVQSLRAGEVISNAMLQATLIALAVISLFLMLLVRRVSLVFLILAPLALAAILTTAAGVLVDIPFNYANVIVLPLLIGIGVDSGIHLVMRQQLADADDGVFGTSTPRAVLFSALTTVASFGSLMLSPHRGTASMGELLSIAIAFTLICTLIVLPAAFKIAERPGNTKA